jgi:AraC-like DNA-binding protein
MQFSGRFLYSMMQFASMQGANIQELIKESGHSVEDLLKEDFMVDSLCYNAVIAKAMELTGDQNLGLHAGEQMSLSGAGLVGQITQSAPTIKEALQFSCEYISLGCRAMPKQLVEEKDHYKLTLTPLPLWYSQSPEVVKQTANGVITFTIREFQNLNFRKSSPIRIEFAYPKPDDTSEHDRIFQCDLKFGTEETAIYFDRLDVEAPVISSNYRLLRVLVEHANQKLNEMRQEESFHDLVKKSMINLVNPQFPTIEEVAANLNLGVRTMQRKLSAEGHTFKDILEGLRKDFAVSYMGSKDVSVNEVANLLNYADGSTFIRSFKRWTGQTPNAYRAGL